MNPKLITLMTFTLLISFAHQMSANDYEVSQCMSAVTHYCQIPQGYKAPGGLLFDKEWCPAWHENVMSVDALHPPPAPEDDRLPVATIAGLAAILDAEQAASQAKLHMQVNYIAQAMQQTIHFISLHQDNPEELTQFIDTLLMYDPIIDSIEYESQQRKLYLKIQTDIFIVPLIQGSEWIYEFPLSDEVTENATADPKFSEDPNETVENTATDSGAGEEVTPVQFIEPFIIKPFFLDALHCMGTITQYCKQPRKRKTPTSKWSDPEWCQAWHSYVMPAF